MSFPLTPAETKSNITFSQAGHITSFCRNLSPETEGYHMRMRCVVMMGFIISMSASGALHAQVSHAYYHVGMNKATGETTPGVNLFSPLGGIVNFRFVDFQGAEHLAAVSCSTVTSHAYSFSTLVPSLPESVYFVEISCEKYFGVNIWDETEGILTPHTELCRTQAIAHEISGTPDDYFRLYSGVNQTIHVLDEYLDMIGHYSLIGGVPTVVPVPQGPNTSYVLTAETPFAASLHDEPNSTGVLQCVRPNDF